MKKERTKGNHNKHYAAYASEAFLLKINQLVRKRVVHFLASGE